MKTKYNRKLKCSVAVSETIEESINELQEFLECDMWSKFNSEHKIPAIKNGKRVILKFYRKDVFKNEKDFINYLRAHFDILRKDVKRLGRKK